MPKIKDISGIKFGFIEAIKVSHLDKKLGSIWICRCDCGQQILKPSTYLRRGTCKSCGCKKSEMCANRRILPNNMAIKNCAYAGHIRSSKVRGIKSFLTKAQYLNIASRPCRYCGEISIRKGHGRDTSIALNSVDRRNNEGYYKITNSDPCCFVCQLMKRDIQADDFLKRIRKIALKATVT